MVRSFRHFDHKRHNLDLEDKEQLQTSVCGCRHTCFRKLVMVFCMSETKSWKSLMEGSVLFLEVAETFPRLPGVSSTELHTHTNQMTEDVHS